MKLGGSEGIKMNRWEKRKTNNRGKWLGKHEGCDRVRYVLRGAMM